MLPQNESIYVDYSATLGESAGGEKRVVITGSGRPLPQTSRVLASTSLVSKGKAIPFPVSDGSREECSPHIYIY